MDSIAILDPTKKPGATTVSRQAASGQLSAVSSQWSDVSDQHSSVSGQPAMHNFGSLALGHDPAASCTLATPRTCPFGGACHTCPTRVQAKLEVGAPDGEYEREADEVAERVMRMPEPCCSGRPDDDDKNKLRRKPDSSLLTALSSPPRGISVSPEVEAQIHSLRGGGRPLSESERAFFEPRFGRDFSSVRIHSDFSAAVAADAVDATAFTVGHDVVLGAGQHAVGSEAGSVLLAHELSHVLQQASFPASGALLRKPSATQAGEVEEKEPILEELAKYGFWCGPGNASEKGKHCAEITDELDRCCCKHDKDYEYLKIHVSEPKGDTVKWTSEEGLARTAAADAALVACSNFNLLADPYLWFDTQARGYQKGVAAIFGTRAIAGYLMRTLGYGVGYANLSPSRTSCDKCKTVRKRRRLGGPDW